MDSKTQNFLIGTIVLFTITLISTLMGWFSFVDSGEVFTASGWNGYVALFKIKIVNWFASILLLLYILVLALKVTKVWSPNLLWFLPLFLIILYHNFTAFVLIFFADITVEMKPGFFLFFVSFISAIILSVNISRQKSVSVIDVDNVLDTDLID